MLNSNSEALRDMLEAILASDDEDAKIAVRFVIEKSFSHLNPVKLQNEDVLNDGT